MTRPRLLAIAAGAAAVVAYLAGAALTGTVEPGLARPLLDGLAPPAPYRWVHTPHIAGIHYADQAPDKARLTIRLTASGSQVASVATRDGQFNALLDDRAIAPKPGQRTVDVSVDPLDAATLGPPPSNLRIAGNAYKVTVVYGPGGAPVSALQGHNDLALLYPLLALSGPGSAASTHSLLFSADGRTWRTGLTGGDNKLGQTVVGSFVGPGYYAAAVPVAQHGSQTRRYLLLGVFLVAAVILIAMVSFTYRARRTRTAKQQR